MVNIEGWDVDLTEAEMDLATGRRDAIQVLIPHAVAVVREYFRLGMGFAEQADVFVNPYGAAPAVRVLFPAVAGGASFVEMTRLLDMDRDCTIVELPDRGNVYALTRAAVCALRSIGLVDDLLNEFQEDGDGNLPMLVNFMDWVSRLNQELLLRSMRNNRKYLEETCQHFSGKEIPEDVLVHPYVRRHANG